MSSWYNQPDRTLLLIAQQGGLCGQMANLCRTNRPPFLAKEPPHTSYDSVTHHSLYRTVLYCKN